MSNDKEHLNGMTNRLIKREKKNYTQQMANTHSFKCTQTKVLATNEASANSNAQLHNYYVL